MNKKLLFSDEQSEFSKLYEKSLQKEAKFKEGEVVKGTVIRVLKDSVLIDIGYKAEGYISIHEFYNISNKLAVKEGDKIDVFIEKIENDDGNIILSKDKADKMRIWDDIAKAYENNEVIEGRVMDKVKGGLSVDIGVKAFLPGSQIDLSPIRDLNRLLGKTYQFKLLKFNKKRGNIVLSRRAILEDERESLKKETLRDISEGKIIKGTVKNITEYGAFIDLGGLDGLLHITDISWGRVNHPTEVFRVGDLVDVMILKYDKNSERVSLGMKQIYPDPWQEASKKYKLNSKVSGHVVSLTDYGAFIELEKGVEGLVHVSEMSWTKKIKNPSQMMKPGDNIDAIILEIDTDNRRLSLGMKQTTPNPWEKISEKYPVGSVIKGQIKKVADFGIFIGLAEEIDGLVHVSDMSWTEKIKNPSERYKEGDEIEAKVLELDVENERLALGVKQLLPDPWTDVNKNYPADTTVNGVITNVTDFGAFIRLPDGIEGLIPASEIHDKEKIKPGTEVIAIVLSTDPVERKLRLSLKAMMRKEEQDAYDDYLKKQGQGEAKLGDLLSKVKGDEKEETEEVEKTEEVKEEVKEEAKAEEKEEVEEEKKEEIPEPEKETVEEAKEE